MFKPMGDRGLSEVPTVWFHPTAMRMIQGWVDACGDEISGLLSVVTVDPTTLYVKAALTCKQQCHGTYTILDDEEKGKIFATHPEPETLIGHWHSHVNMGTSPSGQDDENYAEYMSAMGPGAQVFLALIANKKKELTARIYYPQMGEWDKEKCQWGHVPFFTNPSIQVNWDAVLPADFDAKADVENLVSKYSAPTQYSSTKGRGSLSSPRSVEYGGLIMRNDPPSYQVGGALDHLEDLTVVEFDEYVEAAQELMGIEPEKPCSWDNLYDALSKISMWTTTTSANEYKEAFPGRDLFYDLITYAPVILCLDVDKSGAISSIPDLRKVHSVAPLAVAGGVSFGSDDDEVERYMSQWGMSQ